MIIFLYGQDTYRSRQKLQEIIERYKKIHKTGLNLSSFEGEKLVFQDFQKEFQTVSMFKEKKLTIIRNVFFNNKATDFKEKFLKNSRVFKDSKNIVLFYEGAGISKNDCLFKFLGKEAKTQEFSPLQGEKLKNWARKEIKNYGKDIEPRALDRLIDYIGNDLWRFSNEIRKLVSFQKKDRIILEDLEFLVKPNIETDIFKTIDALALKNKKQALELIHKHLEKGDYPLYLLTMINFQFRNLLLIKCQSTNDMRMPRINNLNKRLGMHPYVVRKTLRQAQKFTLSELKKIYQKIFQADLDIKTGKLDAGTALDLLIAEI